MSLPWHRYYRAGRGIKLPNHQCRHNSAGRPFAEGDYVILRQTRDRTAPPVYRGPLKAGRRIETHKGIIQQDDIIGNRVRELVRTATSRLGKAGQDFRIQDVTLDEHVRLSKRLVTPIYPADANLIVNLLDLHPDVYDAQNPDDEKLEILEAGTGHGSLTIYISRAIQAANPPRPRPGPDEDAESMEAKILEWKNQRKAVLHTIDVAHQYSNHARKTIAAFRHGQYLHNIDFNVGSVSDWTSKALNDRDNEPFLSHAFLDLPNADTHIETVAKALRVDGTLIVFNPSVTQVNECALKIKQDGIPLDLEKVVELGVNGGSGGREWDVRPVKPRAQKLQEAAETSAEQSEEQDSEMVETQPEGEREQAQLAQETTAPSDSEGKWSMVCRPKVGDRIVGGGFLGVFKKQRRHKESTDE